MIYGLSTGTFDDSVAHAVEHAAPPPSKRLEALRRLQAQGHRTFAMLCPILPQDPVAYIKQARERIEFDKCEHVWAEVLNSRGDAIQDTLDALNEAGHTQAASDLRLVFGEGSADRWDADARNTFLALASALPRNATEPKLRFLQYIDKTTKAWWAEHINEGVLLLRAAATAIPAPPQASPDPPTRAVQMNSLPGPALTQIRQLIEEAADAAQFAAAAVRAAAEVAKHAARLLAQVTPPSTANVVAGQSQPSTTPVMGKKRPDPDRSAAAKRAWVTIRAKRAAAAKASHP